MKKIRNFSIIAHVDHGKSTLSDCIIRTCNKFYYSKTENQILDSMELERERGITIKAKNVSLTYKALDGEIYQLNLIDTPGHVDFCYEVFRSLSACEGALLLIDISQGIEAQTITNYRTAIRMNLKVITVINKIDIPIINLDTMLKEIKSTIGVDDHNILRCSAKTGLGIPNILESLVRNIPPPNGDPYAPLQALIIDSWFNNYLGIVSLVRIKNGTLRKGSKIKIMSTSQVYKVERLGIFTPKQIDKNELKCGEVGWLICNNKDILGSSVGDTITEAYNPASSALPSFKKIKPQVYIGLFPVNHNDYKSFRNALNKLSLNDNSLFYEPENSDTLGFGFRCGFLGLLHMEIIKERLEREYNLHLITTMPTVFYEVLMINKKIIYVNNPSKLPPINSILELREPIAECHIFLPKKYLGNVIKLCANKRGIQTNIVYCDNQVILTYEIPMAEIIVDFFNSLKSISHGYASLEYNFKRFQASNVVCMNFFVNGKSIDALTLFLHKKNAHTRGKEIVEKMKNLIPYQQFNVVIQAAIGNTIVASTTLKQLSKNVLVRCHGGDVSRKKKLLQKQKEGKKRMKQIGNIKLPKEIFLNILRN